MIADNNRIAESIRFAASALRGGVAPTLVARWLEAVAADVQTLDLAVMPPAVRTPGGLPTGVADLGAIRARQRRLRVIDGGDAA